MQLSSALTLAALVASPVLAQFTNGTSSSRPANGTASILPIGTSTTTRSTTTTTVRPTVTVIQPVVSVIVVPVVVSTVTRTTVIGGVTTVAVSPVFSTTTSTVRVTAAATTCPVATTRTVTATVCPATTSLRAATTTTSTRPPTTSSTRPATTTTSTRPATTSSIRPTATTGNANCAFPARAAAATLFPNLIVPVQRANPSTSYGTQYFGNIRPGQDIVIQFDVPTTRTYSLQIALPPKSQLTTSNYDLTGDARFAVARVPQTIRSSTTYGQLTANPDTLSYTTFTAAQNQQNLQVILPNPAGVAGTTATYIIRSVSGATLNAFFDYNCPVVGIVLA